MQSRSCIQYRQKTFQLVKEKTKTKQNPSAWWVVDCVAKEAIYQ